MSNIDHNKKSFDFLEEIFEGSGNRVDTRWLVTRALDRIHAVCAYGSSERMATIGELPRRISLGVTMLECLVSPIVDEAYLKELQLFTSNIPIRKLASERIGLNFDIELELSLFKFGCLIRMIDRHNLLYERYVKDLVGKRKEASEEPEELIVQMDMRV